MLSRFIHKYESVRIIPVDFNFIFGIIGALQMHQAHDKPEFYLISTMLRFWWYAKV